MAGLVAGALEVAVVGPREGALELAVVGGRGGSMGVRHGLLGHSVSVLALELAVEGKWRGHGLLGPSVAALALELLALVS